MKIAYSVVHLLFFKNYYHFKCYKTNWVDIFTFGLFLFTKHKISYCFRTLFSFQPELEAHGYNCRRTQMCFYDRCVEKCTAECWSEHKCVHQKNIHHIMNVPNLRFIANLLYMSRVNSLKCDWRHLTWILKSIYNYLALFDVDAWRCTVEKFWVVINSKFLNEILDRNKKQLLPIKYLPN